MADSERQAVLARLQSVLDSSVAKGVPGISAAIHTSKGEQYNLCAGYSDVRANRLLDGTTTFGIGSITKVFIAIVILQLVEEKKLSLDDRAISLIGSKIPSEIQHAETASIRDLLSHIGAIASWEDDPEWIRDGRGQNIQPSRIWNKEEPLRYVKPSATPGVDVGTYHYANTNYTILGMVIKHVTQNTAESEVRRRIIEPLSLTNTYFEGFEKPSIDRTSHRYHWATETFLNIAGMSPHFSKVGDDLVDVTGTNLSVSWVAGGMISNLLKFTVALQSGVLLTPASMATLTDWHDADEEKDVGHGIFRLRHANAPGTWVGHNGGVLGFTGALWWTLDGSCAVSVLSNVGSSHAGKMPSNAALVALRTDFLELATQLSSG